MDYHFLNVRMLLSLTAVGVLSMAATTASAARKTHEASRKAIRSTEVAKAPIGTFGSGIDVPMTLNSQSPLATGADGNGIISDFGVISGKKNMLKSVPMRITPTAPLRACVTYDIDNKSYGMVNVKPEGLEVLREHEGLQAGWGGAGVGTQYYFNVCAEVNGGYVSSVETYLWDTETWTCIGYDQDPSLSVLSYSMTSDPVTETIYGCFFSENLDEIEIGTLDPLSMKRTGVIGTAEKPLFAMGFSSDGTLYGIDSSGVLYTVSLENAKYTKVAETGIVSQYHTAGTVDPFNDVFYYASCPKGPSDDPSKDWALYSIDLKNGYNVEKCWDLRAELGGMYIANAAAKDVKADMPTGSFDYMTKLLTLTCETPGHTIRYAINKPTNWKTYTQPIPIDRNCVVYTKAEAPNYLVSDVAEITISEFKCQEAIIRYNGRYVTLETAELNAEIRYSFDQNNPVDGASYSGIFDAGGLKTVRAIVIKDDFMDSDVTSLELNAYGDDSHAETSKVGLLESAFRWAEEDYLSTLKKIRIEGRLNDADYTLLKEMWQLRHLDIENVAEADVPKNVFNDMENLVSVSMPTEIKTVGDSIFGNNHQLSAVIWNSTSIMPDARTMGKLTNPNFLLYLMGDENVDSELNGMIANIIHNEYAEKITLTDRKPFNAPREFTVDTISYTRNFSKQTPIGDCGGWEMLSLPFDVQNVSNAQSEIVPFAAAWYEDRPFWLFSPTSAGWIREARIMAYRPYLLAMPNNPDYIESFNIRGDVVFSATNATVTVTPEPEELTGEFRFRNGAYLVPNFEHLTAAETRWVVNDEQDGGNLPGSVFVSNLRDVRPFECYLDYESPASRMPIFDTSDMETIMSEWGTDIWCENHDLCILSGIGQRFRIYDTMGQLVRIAEVEGGIICRVRDLAPGIYIVGKTKIMVR